MTNVLLRRWSQSFSSSLRTAIAGAASLATVTLVTVGCSSTPETRSESPSLAADTANDAAILGGDQNGTDSKSNPEGNNSGKSVGVSDASATQDPNTQFKGVQDEAKARQQHLQFLVQEYLKKGKDAYNRLDFTAARSDFASAYLLDPTNKEAEEWLRRAQAQLGEVGAERAQDFQDKRDRAVVMQAEAMQAVQQAILDGDRALEAREFDAAIANYTRAKNILDWYPLLEDQNSQRTLVNNKIALALAKKDSAKREDEDARLRAAELEKRNREVLEREQLENRLRKLYLDANIAFTEGKYDLAIMSLDQLLEIDPMNNRARELRDISQQAKNQRLLETHRKEYNRRWQQAMREADYLLLPQSATIEHDLPHWAKIQDRKPLQLELSTEETNPEDKAVLDRLSTTIFTPSFQNTPITEIAVYLRNLTQVNILVSQKILDMDDAAKSVTMELPKTSVLRFLNALNTVKGFTWRIVDGAVRIGTPDENKGQTEYRIYDVSDLIQVIPNFPASELSLLPPGAPGIPLGTEAEPVPVFSLEQITQIVQSSIAQATWTDAEAKTSIRYVTQSGTLVVRQTREVHQQLERFLNDLREVTNLMVEVQTRFIIAEDNFLEDIGVDWRGLGDNGNSGVGPTGGLGTAPPFDDFGAAPLPGSISQPGPLGTGNQPGFFTQTGSTPIIGKTENIFDQNLSGSNPLTNAGGLSLQWINLGVRESELILRAVDKSERVELVTAPRLLVHSGERANVTVTNQFAYVAGYGVEIAQASSIADPQIDVIEEGAILDVRPVVSADRKFVKLELRPTLANLQLPILQRVVGVGNGTPVTIQFPNLTVRKVRTTVSIPDGGTLLLGGQTIDEVRNESAGVPLLRDVPVLGFFFDRIGKSISKRRLLILLRVKIVIPTEAEPRIPEPASPLLRNNVVAQPASR
jgi:Flp pilus assembly secretin CpaC